MELKTTRVGWRLFKCPSCGLDWKWPCRDSYSMSSEDCPACHEPCAPYNSNIDTSIPVDKMGNLLVSYNWTGDSSYILPAPASTKKEARISLRTEIEELEDTLAVLNYYAGRDGGYSKHYDEWQTILHTLGKLIAKKADVSSS